MRQFCILGTYD